MKYSHFKHPFEQQIVDKDLDDDDFLKKIECFSASPLLFTSFFHCLKYTR